MNCLVSLRKARWANSRGYWRTEGYCRYKRLEIHERKFLSIVFKGKSGVLIYMFSDILEELDSHGTKHLFRPTRGGERKLLQNALQLILILFDLIDRYIPDSLLLDASGNMCKMSCCKENPDHQSRILNHLGVFQCGGVTFRGPEMISSRRNTEAVKLWLKIFLTLTTEVKKR